MGPPQYAPCAPAIPALHRRPERSPPDPSAGWGRRHSQFTPADLRDARRTHQQEGTAVARQCGAGIEASRHTRRSGWLHDELFVVMNTIDRQRVNVPASRAKYDQRTVLLGDIAV